MSEGEIKNVVNLGATLVEVQKGKEELERRFTEMLNEFSQKYPGCRFADINLINAEAYGGKCDYFVSVEVTI